jgi:protein-glutamine gamma-glutamyltransferase
MTALTPMIQRWREQVRSQAPEPREHSRLLRILTQGLVTVGILATDIAADTHISLWAIPLSAIGATWSWHRRHQRNIPTKFLLALGMLLALAAFFHSLVVGRELNDTRLVLAELLIQIQVLHSFDMPRRKDLGYSMVIGLILLGVASTLSQTMAFGGMLLLFLAVGLPVLVMDYRSRLGLGGWWSAATAPQSNGRPAARPRINWRGLPLIFALTLGLGLTIFALMPRLPGYQLRSFPMSAPIQSQQKFDSQRVINPGYVRSGTASQANKKGQGSAPIEGAGKMDDEFYSGFSDRINQNLRGQLKPKLVMRVRSQAEGFWRVVAFDRYTGQGWDNSQNAKTQTIDRPGWSYQFFIPPRVTLNQKQDVVQTYTLVAELPNLIPALDQARELFFPTQQVALDLQNGLRSPVGLNEGLTYTVISEVPYRNRTLLQQADSRFPPPYRENLYVQIPEAIAPKVRQRTLELLAKSPQPITSDYEKALYLAQALKQQYSVQTDLPFLEPNEDLVEAFLFKFKGGYPDHFSTTLTVMLRSIGISARLVAGFSPGQFNPFTGLYQVKNTDAYAMTEVYFHKYGWFTFDPIPGHALVPPSVEADQTFSVLKRFWNWIAGWLPSPVTGFFNRIFGGFFNWLGGLIGYFLGLFSQGWLGVLTALLIGTVLAFGGWLGAQGWGKWRYRRRLGQLDPMARLYQQMLDHMTDRGFPKAPSQTPLEYAQGKPAPVGAITAAYVAWRYGHQGPNLNQLRQEWQQFRRARRG